MTREPEFGKAVPVPTNPLPEVGFDMLEGQAVPAGLGKTATPVHVLPEQTFELLAGEMVLQLTLKLRPEALPGETALDLFRLYAAMHQLELSCGGTGLAPEAGGCAYNPTDGKLQLTFRPTALHGVAGHLNQLVAAIRADVGKTCGSIEVCEAKVVPTAA